MVLYRSRNVRTRSTRIIVGIIFYCISLYVVRVPKNISYSLFYEVFQLLFCTVIFFWWFYFVPRAASEVS